MFIDDAMLHYLYKAEKVVIPGAMWDTRAFARLRNQGS
jgi:hypothetical protein